MKKKFPCFCQLSLLAFPISVIKKYLICRKSSFHALILSNIFLKRYRHPLSCSSQHPWNPKHNKVDIFAKPTFQEVSQCYRTHTHIKIFLIYKLLILNQKTALVVTVTIYWTLAPGCFKFAVTLSLTFRILYFQKWKVLLQ